MYRPPSRRRREPGRGAEYLHLQQYPRHRDIGRDDAGHGRLSRLREARAVETHSRGPGNRSVERERAGFEEGGGRRTGGD